MGTAHHNSVFHYIVTGLALAFLLPCSSAAIEATTGDLQIVLDYRAFLPRKELPTEAYFLSLANKNTKVYFYSPTQLTIEEAFEGRLPTKTAGLLSSLRKEKQARTSGGGFREGDPFVLAWNEMRVTGILQESSGKVQQVVGALLEVWKQLKPVESSNHYLRVDLIEEQRLVRLRRSGNTRELTSHELPRSIRQNLTTTLRLLPSITPLDAAAAELLHESRGRTGVLLLSMGRKSYQMTILTTSKSRKGDRR